MLNALECQAPVQVEVPEALPARLERIEMAQRVANLNIQLKIEAINTPRVDFNIFLEHQSSQKNRYASPAATSPSKTSNQLDQTLENPLTADLRAQNRIQLFQDIFASGQNSTKITAVERRILLADDISKVSFQKLARIRTSIPLTQ